jgi:rod shape-determining protein MreD
MEGREHDWVIPFVSVIAALALAVVPLPGAITPFRPDWVALVLLYWSLVSPRRFGLLTAFWTGLALDTLNGALLGQHALALLVIVYLSRRFYLRLRVFPISQLTVAVTALLLLYEFVLFWVDGVAGRTVPLIERWAPVVSGALLWLLVVGVVGRGRERVQARI